MTEYVDKTAGVAAAKTAINGHTYNLHPIDQVEAFRELSSWAEEKANAQEEENELDGVPERDET